MNSRDFVRALRIAVRRPSIAGTLAAAADPPVRRPTSDAISRSKWLNSLDEGERVHVESVVTEAVDSAIFGLLCVIDGVRAVEPPGPKGRFELWHIGQDKVLLNGTDRAHLHDIYNDPHESRTDAS